MALITATRNVDNWRVADVSTDLRRIATTYNFTKYVDYYNAPTPQLGMIFVTKPDLNLSLDNIKSDDMLAGIATMSDWGVYKELLTGGEGFIPLLHNRALNYDVKPFTLNTSEKGLTYFGSAIMYGKHSSERLKPQSISINFSNDRYFSVLKLCAIWSRYIFLVSRGRIAPLEKYEFSAQLDYASSLYYYGTDIGARKITYWEKQVGFFPIEVPFDVFSMDDTPKITDTVSIGFQSCLPDDPYSLSAMTEFQMQNDMEYNPDRFNGYKLVGPKFATKPSVTANIGYDINGAATGNLDWMFSWHK